ncbi:BnaC01g37120D [Brassica napus]|uniref:BnaC01g37120D protein n=1 Tax=Brassica napus TaxID=3708 RepID=A0A078H6U3_BRANA|nr:BnaC01g37120D [Brassica napus]
MGSQRSFVSSKLSPFNMRLSFIVFVSI